MPKTDPKKTQGVGHVHNSPTRVGDREVDSCRPWERMMSVLRNGEHLLVRPESVKPGDRILARDGQPLKGEK